MQAIILAAGRGVRMLPLTENTPKPLLKVSGRSILERTISQLPDEVQEVVVVIGHFGEQIKEALKNSSKKITFVESELKGSGWAVSVCKDVIKGDFLVVNGDDLYKKEDLEKLAKSNAPAFLVKDVSREKDFPQNFRRFGKIITDTDGNFVSLLPSVSEDFTAPFFVLMGAYKLNQEFFGYDLVQLKNGEYGLPQTMFQMVDKYKVKTVEAGFWLPIGYPEDIKRAEEALAQHA